MNEIPRRSAFADRRHRIVAAAAHLFADTPYQDVHMDDLAAAASVAKPTLYRYFPTKEALFMAALEWALADIEREIRAAGARPGSAEARLRGVIGLMLDRIGRLAPAIRAVESQSSDIGERSRRVLRQGFANLKDSLRSLLADGIEGGELGGVDLDVAVLVVLGGVRMSAHAKTVKGKALADTVADILFNGLRARDAEAASGPTQILSGAVA